MNIPKCHLTRGRGEGPWVRPTDVESKELKRIELRRLKCDSRPKPQGPCCSAPNSAPIKGLEVAYTRSTGDQSTFTPSCARRTIQSIFLPHTFGNGPVDRKSSNWLKEIAKNKH